MSLNKFKTAAIFTAIWFFFIIRGIESATILPIWEGFDEWLHYSYVAYLERTGNLPLLSSPSVPKEVFDSLRIAPGPSSKNHMSYKEFWSLPQDETATNISQIHALSNQPGSHYEISSWQAQHPPLYYILLTPFYKLFSNFSILKSLQAFRIISIFIASLGLIPAYLLFRLFFERSISLFGVLLFSSFPATFILFGHMTNDCLAFPLITALIYLTMRRLKAGEIKYGSIWLGIILGLGILTKLYILSMVPALFFVSFFTPMEKLDRRKNKFLFLLLLTGIALAISLPWFIHNIHHYGTWNSTVHAVSSQRASMIDKISFLRLVPWKGFLVSMAIGTFWSGNWSFVCFPPMFYKIYILIILSMIAGIAGGVLLKKIKPDKSEWLLLSFPLFFFLAMLQHQLQIRLAGNLDPMGGWYWAVLLPTHILFLFIIFSKISALFFYKMVPWLTLGCYLFSMIGNMGLLVPYYSGYPFSSFSWVDRLQRLSQLNGVPIDIFTILYFLNAGLFILIIVYLIRVIKSPCKTD